ncbi:MAG: HEAT repeat domain-containing protein [Gemmatimonadetes bacterium]|uniref:HEAT repeat domain-containing protein n=1 Tax=Candidatus Kutchimonas denitrificans TaxID=3056748 RepID=A0AAE4ZBF7_9BACT|nr:HEAT repeat domain-containing protein [Gemmatimonadota bacterium]NIR75831.1 HEAT repeat domain-containing protein [Candidatus Kutchimonas denitrificans]NIS01998.1 HEAT repeat domain-containing protein [Gemmatimonadota bacterium]NIT67802.1 HEAT repeat domain-containing protein [Gemmatimonadota bacterium]NIU53789.1 hypothetical protein [Gemmatimonadota bacterium]
MSLQRVLWLGGAAFFMALGALRIGSPQLSGDPDPALSDSALAVRFLDGVRGATPLACDVVIRSLGIGYGWRHIQVEPDGSADGSEVLRWAQRRSHDPQVIPVLRRHMEDSDVCVRRVAARLLGRTRQPQAVSVLTAALGSPNPTTRQLAAIGLGYAEERSTVDPLLSRLSDEVPAVRAAAAWALGEVEDVRAVAPLSRLLRNDSDPAVRRAAAMALGTMY